MPLSDFTSWMVTAARAGMSAGSVRKTTASKRRGDDRREPDPAKLVHHLEIPSQFWTGAGGSR